MPNTTAGSQAAPNAERQDIREVSLNPALLPVICAAILYAVSWIAGCTGAGNAGPGFADRKKATAGPQALLPPDGEQVLPAKSGRLLTIEKMAQRAATTLEFSNEEYGVAFDAPKGYLLKEGELPDMDRGLGYLGPVPMHFAEAGGVRLATVEPPTGVHTGSNFVNEFFTLSAFYGANPDSCAAFDIGAEFRGAIVTRTVSGIPFRGVEERAAASMHQYTGVYLHGYANETCYEIGYGVATIGDDAARNIKHIDSNRQLQRLEKILDTVRIAPPDFERFTATD